MNLSQLIEATRTVQQFVPGIEIPQELIQKVLNNSLLAPNHRLTFPWQWVLASEGTRKKLAQLAILIQEKKNGAPFEQHQKDKIFKGHLDPSELLVLAQKKNNDPFTAKEDYATLACSVQLLALSLREHELGYKWGTGAVTRLAETYQILELDPEFFQIEGFIWIGKEVQPALLKTRPSLSDIFKIV